MYLSQVVVVATLCTLAFHLHLRARRSCNNIYPSHQQPSISFSHTHIFIYQPFHSPTFGLHHHFRDTNADRSGSPDMLPRQHRGRISSSCCNLAQSRHWPSRAARTSFETSPHHSQPRRVLSHPLYHPRRLGNPWERVLSQSPGSR